MSKTLGKQITSSAPTHLLEQQGRPGREIGPVLFHATGVEVSPNPARRILRGFPPAGATSVRGPGASGEARLQTACPRVLVPRGFHGASTRYFSLPLPSIPGTPRVPHQRLHLTVESRAAASTQRRPYSHETEFRGRTSDPGRDFSARLRASASIALHIPRNADAVRRKHGTIHTARHPSRRLLNWGQGGTWLAEWGRGGGVAPALPDQRRCRTLRAKGHPDGTHGELDDDVALGELGDGVDDGRQGRDAQIEVARQDPGQGRDGPVEVRVHACQGDRGREGTTTEKGPRWTR